MHQTLFLNTLKLENPQSLPLGLVDGSSLLSHHLLLSYQSKHRSCYRRYWLFSKITTGKIKNHRSIDCNDEGAYYSVARVNCDLVDCLNHPNLSSFLKFIPRCPFLHANYGRSCSYDTSEQVCMRHCHWSSCLPHDRGWKRP